MFANYYALYAALLSVTFIFVNSHE